MYIAFLILLIIAKEKTGKVLVGLLIGFLILGELLNFI